MGYEDLALLGLIKEDDDNDADRETSMVVMNMFNYDTENKKLQWLS